MLATIRRVKEAAKLAYNLGVKIVSSSGDGKKAKRKKKGSTNVPGTYLGFSLQASRCLIRLLGAQAGDVVCLEVFDDVGVERLDGSRVSEQSKSNQTYNPLTDRAVDLWKTLANWATAVKEGELDVENTHFELVTSRPAGGPIARSFRDAKTPDDALTAIAAAHAKLFKPAVKTGEASISESLSPQLSKFFGIDRNLAIGIVVRFSYQAGAGDTYAELKAAMRRELVSEENCDDVLIWATGWVKSEIDRLLQQGKPARIREDSFRSKLLNYVRTHDRHEMLHSVAGSVEVPMLQPEDDMLTYVKQLRLIEADDEDVLYAVNDFLRASIDRTHWSAEGLIDERSIEKYSKELSRSWKNKKEQVRLAHPDRPQTHQGKLLYHGCQEHSISLDGYPTQPHFTRGSWHALADDESIGWHPNHKDELNQQSKQGGGDQELKK
ncbi:MAG: hypothetical protein P4L85_02035 [Paludisphaera borealis]|uniref:ABC-three component system protein n=1 Tax=Paludisphaera borealis TaxID=1387353 RepID=UPI00283D373C|nr:ABC-three component system protein [Paludisphaera borealis]MDR3618101.1 hypothetical protein [Paludisphaera borealis]